MGGAISKDAAHVPVFRLFKDAGLAFAQPKIGLTDMHVSHHICWPWDLDMWMELNNGRALTLFDLGRFGLMIRNGIGVATRKQGWGMAVAGSAPQYRKRVRGFDRITMKSRFVCWDDKFFYMEQSMWNSAGHCTNHIVLRIAVTGPGGLVRMDEVTQALGGGLTSPPMPDWVAEWSRAEAHRPWPPMQDALA